MMLGILTRVSVIWEKRIRGWNIKEGKQLKGPWDQWQRRGLFLTNVEKMTAQRERRAAVCREKQRAVGEEKESRYLYFSFER